MIRRFKIDKLFNYHHNKKEDNDSLYSRGIKNLAGDIAEATIEIENEDISDYLSDTQSAEYANKSIHDNIYKGKVSKYKMPLKMRYSKEREN